MILIGFAMLAPVAAQIPATELRVGRPGQSSIYSADRRFMVSGLTSAENMVLAGRLSELAAKIETKTGMTLPMRRDQVLGVMVQSSSSPDTQVLKMQGWDDGRFYQRLIVPGRYRLDGEDLLEGACWLLLNRYAAEYAPANQRSGIGASVPEWISAGLVQNSQAALRSRNRDWIARELADGRHVPLAQVVKMEVLPPGRWKEKAYAAAAVEFLFPEGEIDTWATLFKAVGQRQPITPAWLRQHAAALAGKNPESAWSEHLAEQARSRTIEAWGDQGMHLEEQLLHVLNFRPRELGADVPAEVPGDLFASDLIEYRNQPWAGAVAAALLLRVQGLKIGAPPPLQEVLSGYSSYFAQFSNPPAEKTAWWKRTKTDPRKPQASDDATWQIALNQLWLRAERIHQQFLEGNQSRKRYLDAFDMPVASDFDEGLPAAFEMPRTRWQRYVDEIEARWANDLHFMP